MTTGKTPILSSREIEVVKVFAEAIYVHGEHDGFTVECNWCNEKWGNVDIEDAYQRILEHILAYHPEKFTPAIVPVTQEEIAEVFGVPLPLR